MKIVVMKRMSDGCDVYKDGTRSSGPLELQITHRTFCGLHERYKEHFEYRCQKEHIGKNVG